MNARAKGTELVAQAVSPILIHTPEADKLIAHAIDKDVPIEKLERLLAMRDKLRAEAAKAAYLSAMSKFQAECPVINKGRTARIKSKSGAQFTYRYAELGAIVKVAAPIAAGHGLSYAIRCELVQEPVPSQVATVIVSHVLGHSEQSTFRAPIDLGAVVNDMQKAASAQTFAKRIAFCNAFGILTHSEDDDGRVGGARDDDDLSPETGQHQESRVAAPRSKPEEKDDGTPATEAQVKLIRAKLENTGLSTADMKKRFGFDLSNLTKAKVNPVLEWIRNPVPAGA